MKKKKTTKKYSEGEYDVYHRVAIRDNYQCRICGDASYQIHHIKYRSAFGKDEDNNLVCLCQMCHDDVHSHRVLLTVQTVPTFELFITRRRK